MFQISNLYNFSVGSSLNCIQVDLDHNYGEVLNTYDDIAFEYSFCNCGVYCSRGKVGQDTCGRLYCSSLGL